MAETKLDIKTQTKSLCKELFSLLGISLDFDIELIEAQDSLKTVEIDLKSQKEKGLLIGRRGATLLAIQSFLGIALKQKLGEWVRVVVNVGDWRERVEEHLGQLADSAANRARETGEPQNLYNLSPSQRRIIHLYLQKEKDIITESSGEGTERYLVVRLKK